MLTTFQKYVYLALASAKYEYDTEARVYIASIPKLSGVVVQAKTIEGARNELAEAIESWVFIGLQHGDEIPTIGGVKIPQLKTRSKFAHA